MLPASIPKNDRKAKRVIWIFSVTVFIAIALLGNFHVPAPEGFDVHVFAAFNAVVNTVTAVLLLVAFMAVRTRRYRLHKRLMITALVLSVLFLLSYVAHHLMAGEAKFGDANHDGVVSPEELSAVGVWRTIYLVILGTHILLASVILPFILFTAYRGLTADYGAHRKLARYTWPLWLYVALSGPLIYWMISPYYT